MHPTKPIAGLAALLTAVAAVGGPVTFVAAGPDTAALATAALVAVLVVAWTAAGRRGRGGTPYW
ncbi:hypothetical protein [Halostella litorea]|uniref:hypothetical protein n=1 Tax=Halostella litorea TaxID=2528831 RepID=UPI0010919457|nr:hypothetical protein [Halostella litorea]